MNFRQQWLLLTFMVCCMPVALSASTPGMTVAHYDVTTRGFRIGTAHTSQRFSVIGGEPTVHFETKTDVKASFLWLGYRLAVVETGVLKNGVLVGYSRQGEENGRKLAVKGRFDGAVFRFDSVENGVAKTIHIPRSEYDGTTVECPEARLDFRKNEAVTLRILDVELQTVVRREYRLVGEGSHTIERTTYPCRIIEYRDPNKHARRWFRHDETSVVMFRQDGRGSSGYSVKAVKLAREE